MSVYLFRTVKTSAYQRPNYDYVETPKPLIFGAGGVLHHNEYLLELDQPSQDQIDYFAATLVLAERQLMLTTQWLFVSVWAVSEDTPLDMDSPCEVLYPQCRAFDQAHPDGRNYEQQVFVKGDMQRNPYQILGDKFLCYADSGAGRDLNSQFNLGYIDPFVSFTIKMRRDKGHSKVLKFMACVTAQDGYYTPQGTCVLIANSELMRRRFPQFCDVFKYITPALANATLHEDGTYSPAEPAYLRLYPHCISNEITRRRQWCASRRCKAVLDYNIAQAALIGNTKFNALFNDCVRYSYNSEFGMIPPNNLGIMTSLLQSVAQAIRAISLDHTPVGANDPTNNSYVKPAYIDRGRFFGSGFKRESLDAFLQSSVFADYYTPPFFAWMGRPSPFENYQFWYSYQKNLDYWRGQRNFAQIDYYLNADLQMTYQETYLQNILAVQARFMRQIGIIEKFCKIKPQQKRPMKASRPYFVLQAQATAAQGPFIPQLPNESSAAYKTRSAAEKAEFERINRLPMLQVPRLPQMPAKWDFAYFGLPRYMGKHVEFAWRRLDLGASARNNGAAPFGPQQNANTGHTHIKHDNTVHPITNEEEDEQAVAMLEAVEERAKTAEGTLYALLEKLAESRGVPIPPGFVVNPVLKIWIDEINPNDAPEIQYGLPKQPTGWGDTTEPKWYI
jgi:hypothetical protein